MHLVPDGPEAGNEDGYLAGRRQAWFAFAMTFALMLFDYIDRQVIVSLFPLIKSEWSLSDKQLGSLVSIISVVVAAGGIPVALLADRVSRVKSIVVMGAVWSVATSHACSPPATASCSWHVRWWGRVKPAMAR